MNQPPKNLPTRPAAPAERDEKLLPLVGWITYICGLGVVGVVIAYIDRGNARDLERDNYTYMIRTFWIGLLYAALPLVVFGVVTLRSVAGMSSNPDAGFETMKTGLSGGPGDWFVYLFAVQGGFVVLYLWFLARCIKGLVTLVRELPIANPKTWLV